MQARIHTTDHDDHRWTRYGLPLQAAAVELAQTSGPARRFKELIYRTRRSWSRPRRVGAKAKQTGDKTNPRFIVTSLSRQQWPGRELYEQLYCARGEMENRIKEAQLNLFADRLSTETFRANQLRLWFSSAAYVSRALEVDRLLEVMSSKFCDLLELKLPYDELVRRLASASRVRFRDFVGEAVAQLKEYQRYFEDPGNRKAFQARYGLEAYRPSMILVCGRRHHFRSDVERRELRALLPDDLTLWTHDDVLERARRFRALSSRR